MPPDDIDRTHPSQLGALLSVDPARQAIWEPADLAAILRHQLDTPLEVELGGDAGQPMTFDQLLHDPNPPLELLERAKRFAKSSKTDPHSAVPAEVATVLYYACILVARARCGAAGATISSLEDPTLLAGAAWVLEQPWVDARTRGLFERAGEFLSAPTDSDATAPSPGYRVRHGSG